MTRPSNSFVSKPRTKSNKKVRNWFFGLEIDRKTNILSLVAFTLSIAGVASQIYFFFQGPIVSLQPPDGIAFYASLSSDKNETHYLRIASPMAYVNTGQPGFNDAIKRETAILHIGNNTYSFIWYKFVNSNSEGSKFCEKPLNDARPVTINAGSVEAHETSFQAKAEPTSKAGYGINFLKFSEFKELALAEEEIFVSFQFETFSGTTGKVSCKVLINSSFREAIKNNWSSPPCV